MCHSRQPASLDSPEQGERRPKGTQGDVGGVAECWEVSQGCTHRVEASLAQGWLAKGVLVQIQGLFS